MSPASTVTSVGLQGKPTLINFYFRAVRAVHPRSGAHEQLHGPTYTEMNFLAFSWKRSDGGARLHR